MIRLKKTETYIKIYFATANGRAILCAMKDKDYKRMLNKGLILYNHNIGKPINVIDMSNEEYNDIKSIMGTPFITKLDSDIEIISETFWA